MKHKPNLILMDIQLPEISGLEVTKWIKQDETVKHIPRRCRHRIRDERR
jgi:two-component system cell cycle response regulator DivK